MSPVHVTWDPQNARILRITLSDPVDWPAVEAARQRQDRTDFPEYWVALVDVSGTATLPPISMFRLAQLLSGRSVGARAFAVVGAGRLGATVPPRLGRLFPTLGTHLYVARDELEARAWLTERLAILGDPAAPPVRPD